MYSNAASTAGVTESQILYVCMYVSRYACMYVSMHVCMYVCMHACMHTCKYVLICGLLNDFSTAVVRLQRYRMVSALRVATVCKCLWSDLRNVPAFVWRE